MSNAFCSSFDFHEPCFIRACDWISSVFIIYIGKQKQGLINIRNVRCAPHFYTATWSALIIPAYKSKREKDGHVLQVNTVNECPHVFWDGFMRCFERKHKCIKSHKWVSQDGCRMLLCNNGPLLRKTATLWISLVPYSPVTLVTSSTACFCPLASARCSITLIQNHFDLLSLGVNRQILSRG